MQMESRTHNQSADRFPQLLAMAPKWKSINPEMELLLTDSSETLCTPDYGFSRLWWRCRQWEECRRWLKGLERKKLQLHLHRVGSIVVFWPDPRITNQSCNHPKIASEKSLLNNYEWRCRHGCDDDEWQWIFRKKNQKKRIESVLEGLQTRWRWLEAPGERERKE